MWLFISVANEGNHIFWVPTICGFSSVRPSATDKEPLPVLEIIKKEKGLLDVDKNYPTRRIESSIEGEHLPFLIRCHQASLPVSFAKCLLGAGHCANPLSIPLIQSLQWLWEPGIILFYRWENWSSEHKPWGDTAGPSVSATHILAPRGSDALASGAFAGPGRAALPRASWSPMI